MKKLICTALAAVMLTGCAAGGSSESTLPESEGSSTSSSSAVSTVSSVSSSTSTLSSTGTSSGASSSSSSRSPESVPVSFELPEDFRLADCLPGFDDIKPMGYTVTAIAENTCEQEVTDKAIEAYVSSAYFAEALETAYDRFHIENGKLVPNTDLDEEHISSYLSMWGYGLSVNNNDELEIETEVLGGITAKFDGENDESIVLLISYMPSSFFEWSGAVPAYYPVVYINSAGEASVIGTLSRQTLQSVDMIEFDDGTIHLMVKSGHTVGTARCYIVSFENGKPECELVLSDVLCEDGIFYSCPYFGLKFPFFWNGKAYCGISGAKPGNVEIICGNKDVLEAVPDAQREYDEGTLFIIGGKYVTFARQQVTFTLTDSGFEKIDGMIYHSEGRLFNRVTFGEDTEQFDFGEEIELPLYNILLN